MARSPRKSSSNGAVGLDLDGAFIAAVQASDGAIARAVSQDLEPGLISEGEVADGPALSAVLKAFFKEKELPRRVRLGVSNQQIAVRSLELPRIENAAERAAAVRFQAADAIAMPLDEAVLDHQVVGETVSPDGAARSQVVVVAAREAMIVEFVEAVRGAGLKPESIDLNAFALLRTLAGDAADDQTARVHCHLGGVTNLAIAVGSACLFTRPLSTDWKDADDQLATTLAEEIRLSMDFYMAQPDARLASEILLSGPGSKRDGLADELGALLYMPVSVAPPLGRIDASALSDEDPHRHTVALGLALGASS